MADSFRWSAVVRDSVLPTLTVLLPFIIQGTASLMVRRVPYLQLFIRLFRGQRGPRKIVQMVFVGVLVFAVHEAALLLLPLRLEMGPRSSSTTQIFPNPYSHNAVSTFWGHIREPVHSSAIASRCRSICQNCLTLCLRIPSSSRRCRI